MQVSRGQRNVKNFCQCFIRLAFYSGSTVVRFLSVQISEQITDTATPSCRHYLRVCKPKLDFYEWFALLEDSELYFKVMFT